MKCMVIIFVKDVYKCGCVYVRRKKIIMISARGIIGVASHGMRTGATGHLKKFDDSVYAYHDNATRKNDGSCPLPGS